MNIVLTLSSWAHCVKSFYDKGLLIKDVLFKHQELSVNFSINWGTAYEEFDIVEGVN